MTTGETRRYAIIKTRYWRGPDITRTLLTDGRRVYTWSTYDEACKWIREAEDGDYDMSRDEYAEPNYSIVGVGSPQFLKIYRMTHGREYRGDGDCVSAG